MCARQIKLQNSEATWVDESDYKKYADEKWCWVRTSKNKYYVAKRTYHIDSKSYTFDYLHRLIMGLDHGDKLTVDHKDGNPLNNCKSNLRICSQQENSFNSKGSKKYKGVIKCGKKFVAQIKYNYKMIYLGIYDTIEQAASAYNGASRVLFKEFSRPNKIIGEL